MGMYTGSLLLRVYTSSIAIEFAQSQDHCVTSRLRCKTWSLHNFKTPNKVDLT